VILDVVWIVGINVRRFCIWMCIGSAVIVRESEVRMMKFQADWGIFCSIDNQRLFSLLILSKNRIWLSMVNRAAILCAESGNKATVARSHCMWPSRG
jgi:hypothetical protein